MQEIPPRIARKIDIKGCIALAWAVMFGLAYVEMLLRVRAPGILVAIHHLIDR